MTRSTTFLESVLAARPLPSAEDRRGVARVALTVWGRSLGDRPSDLSTADADLLIAAAQLIVDEKLGAQGGATEHLGPAAGAALYELTGALPRGPLRSELGRSVATLLYQGTAPTFAAIATRMAQSGARALSGPGVEARIALSMFLPLDIDAGIDAFALAIAAQRELGATWVIDASTRSLPERRLASRLILRAAREATRRAQSGDRDALSLLLEEPPLARRVSAPPISVPPPRSQRSSSAPPPLRTLAIAWDELVGEREGAVWKFAAAARGLVAGADDEVRDEILASLNVEAGPTAWRRAACALGANLATSGDDAFVRAMELAKSDLVARDPGVLAALVWGLSVAADVEPEACDELLGELAVIAPITIAEPLVELRREVRGAGDRARVPCRNALTASLERGDRDLGLLALARDVRDELDGTAERKLQPILDSALMVFADVGAAAAHARAAAALGAADEVVHQLEALGAASAEVRATQATPLVREADMTLLESRVLHALLALGARGASAAERHPESAATTALDERLAVLLLAREAREEPDAAQQATHHQRNLRALLHLVDATATEEASDERRDQLRIRCERVVLATTDRVAAAQTSPLTRAVAATLARALDALVRHGFADAADVWLFAGARDLDDAIIAILAEASRNPDVIAVLEPGARFAAQVREARSERASAPEALGTEARIGALSRLSTGMHAGVSQGGDHLRRSLGRLARDLETLLVDPSADRADSVTRELDALRPLVTAAIQRCAGRVRDRRRRVAVPPVAAATRISFEGLADWVRDAEDELPRDVARLAQETLRLAALRLPEHGPSEQALVETSTGATFVAAGAAASRASATGLLPARTDDEAAPTSIATPVPTGLPAWIPRRRTLGGFYVHERLGFGASGSVFVVSRVDEHDDPDAERYALKVPEWDAATSRTLSETEFLRLFRSEASALMELPEHPNLASFVTFDAGARPKPILVMELVQGESCEQLIDRRGLDCARAFDVMDGVLAGLVAMHAAGVGHLDIKPSNVILRNGDIPVLVDFGLAGRRMRPGCGTVGYGAPEVWLEQADVSPTRIDVYAFACFAFEMLTARPLFVAPSDHAVVAAHLTHDGGPPALASLGDGPAQKLSTILSECLRRDPEQRPTALDLRRRFGALRSAVVGARWPLGA